MSEKIEVILLDIGNSKIKSAEVINGEIGPTQQWDELGDLILKYDSSIPIMYCSTRQIDDVVFGDRDITGLTHLSKMPIELDYTTPETLGTDRIAAAVGALHLFPEQNTLLIDLGTCLTMDFVDSKGVFKGGVIAPGLKMRMKAMASYTDKLPDISNEWQSMIPELIGKSTKECLLSGSYTSILHEIRGIISEFEKDFTSINVILSGGDAEFFESKLKAHIFAGSKIVQRGLYRIWKYQLT